MLPTAFLSSVMKRLKKRLGTRKKKKRSKRIKKENLLLLKLTTRAREKWREGAWRKGSGVRGKGGGNPRRNRGALGPWQKGMENRGEREGAIAAKLRFAEAVEGL